MDSAFCINGWSCQHLYADESHHMDWEEKLHPVCGSQHNHMQWLLLHERENCHKQTVSVFFLNLFIYFFLLQKYFLSVFEVWLYGGSVGWFSIEVLPISVLQCAAVSHTQDSTHSPNIGLLSYLVTLKEQLGVSVCVFLTCVRVCCPVFDK